MFRDYIGGFWARYPLGTKLTWSFISHGLNRHYILVYRFANATRFLLLEPTRIKWRWLAESLIRVTKKDFANSRFRQDSRLAKITFFSGYYLYGFPIINLIAAFSALLSALVKVFLFIKMVVFLGLYLFLIPVFFVLWVVFYRYPVFEVIYPRIQARMLISNPLVYTPLATDSKMVRVVQLKPGNAHDTVDCELLSGDLADMDFVALSYVWGTTLATHKIMVDGQPFYIPRNLHNVLQGLRLPARERLLWIDAICINQHDHLEKSVQVQIMREIYVKASKTVVWLGQESDATSQTFDFLRQFDATSSETRDELWNSLWTSPSWQMVYQEFSQILRHEWWRRAWVIQEVVVSHEVVVQRGCQQLNWEFLHTLMSFQSFKKKMGHISQYQFTRDVQELRLGTQTVQYGLDLNSLFELVYQFRFQCATFGSDKIYALMGLLPTDDRSLLIPEDDKQPEEVFMQLTVSSLRHNKDLNAIAVAADTALPNASWCRDWRYTHDSTFDGTLPFCVLSIPWEPYSSSGTQPPICEFDLNRCVLSLQGYEADTIARTGDFARTVGKDVDLEWILQSWERVIGKHQFENLEVKKSFNRTIAMGLRTEELVDWRERIGGPLDTPDNNFNSLYKNLVRHAITNRCFFVTKKGKFGLGAWNVQKGDKVCVLFGGKTPFVLRQKHTYHKRKKLLDDDMNEVKIYHKVVGEAFVDGLMYYEGSMEDDISTGKVVAIWFHLQ
jgi:hypothetical protein